MELESARDGCGMPLKNMFSLSEVRIWNVEDQNRKTPTEDSDRRHLWYVVHTADTLWTYLFLLECSQFCSFFPSIPTFSFPD